MHTDLSRPLLSSNVIDKNKPGSQPTTVTAVPRAPTESSRNAARAMSSSPVTTVAISSPNEAMAAALLTSEAALLTSESEGGAVSVAVSGPGPGPGAAGPLLFLNEDDSHIQRSASRGGVQVSGYFDEFADVDGDGEVDTDDLELHHAATGTCHHDVDHNGQTDIDDLLDVIAGWGIWSGPCGPDLNFDGVVDVDDILIVLGDWAN